MGRVGKNFWIEPPLHVAYGSQIAIGENFYANFNLVVVDDGKVLIGDNVMIAPNVTIVYHGAPGGSCGAYYRPSSFLCPSPLKIMSGLVVGSSLTLASP
ncbi:Galactoside O-acetyltransferase [Serratia fonticola]|uniref:Acetyltransferase n=1 Tax=Serratia fonticola TaxID=47917 RepID=A0A4U9TYK0_SERFO|nr:Galactoside O-acetyltransferase [Serratia fonticola]